LPRRGVLRLYLAAVLVLALVFLESVTVHPRLAVSRLSGVVNSVLLPLELGTHSAVQWTAGAVDAVGGAFSAERQNGALRAQVSRLEAQVASLQAVQGQNSRLKQLLKLRDNSLKRFHTLAAPVVGRSPVNWLDQIVIAAGSAEGVKYGDPVLSYGGMVGRVIAVGGQSATVMLLPDPESAIGAMVARSGDAGVLDGNGEASTLKMQFFAAGANVRRGDLIVTSGLDGTLPPGVPLGRVTATGQGDFGLVHQADVAPLANLDRLDTVLVVLQ
jgi:rod shape-determining protein MreC